jgi:hypothetical protein
MIEKLLANCLEPVLAAEAQLRQRRVLISVLILGAIGFTVLFALSVFQDWWSWKAVFGWLGFLTLIGLIGLIRANREPDLREIAKKVEENHPDLQAALLAAMDQKPSADGELSYLQKRLLADVSGHAVTNKWVRQVSSKRLFAAGWGQFAALVGFCLSVWMLLGVAPGSKPKTVAEIPPTEVVEPDPGAVTVSVSPGDVELEKGSRLVVEATFPGRVPGNAMMVVQNKDGEKRVPMTVGLDDSVFSALLPKVDLSGSYRIQFEEENSDEFAITVFEFPALQQADALVTSPAFLKKEPEEIIDTRKITVMEGSTVDWKLRINKPIVMAELFGEDEVSIPLKPDPADPTLLLATHAPAKSQRYRVHLVDEADRSNKRPPWLTVNVKENLPPELKLTFPGKDFEVTAVQELPIEGEAWDDVQIESAGFAYQYGEEEKMVTLSEASLPGGEKHPLSTQIDLEELGAEPRELITYYFWAEDRDNDGNLRRTTSDMFFAEVRFFEDIIREGQPQSGQGAGQQGESEELLKLQKDIINAAWKLRRYHELGRKFETISPDVDVVQQSQGVVIAKTAEVIEKAEDAELKQIFTDAKVLMEKAAAEFALVLSERNGDLISPAHQTARAVFAKLIEARARESQVSMQKSPSQGASQQKEQTNMNLELEQKELKYEEQSQAEQEQQSAEQKENLAILSRLKDLAKRQEAIAKKIKELEEQLQNADEEKKAEIERQLKRLQEEQRELLRETDDLSERMDSEENQSRMAEEREKLEKTREDIQETAENLESGELADAANSATRAQRELEEMEEEFRERTSRKFAEEMRGLRDTARQLSENQKQIGEQLEELTNSDSEDPFESEEQKDRAELAQSISNQARALSDLVEDIKKLSEEAESSEPILSDSLYEAVRNTIMGGVQESLDEARDYTFYNRPNQALQPEQAAARGIEELRENVEAAAEKVLGNEADALRLARSELDRLIEDSKEEAQRLAGEEQSGEKSGEDGKDPGTQASTGTGEQPGTDRPDEAPRRRMVPLPGSGDEKEKGKGDSAKQASKAPGSGEGEEPGEKGKGKAPGKGEGEGSLAEGEQPGEKGKGKAPGKGEGEGSMAQGEEPGEKGKGKAPGKGEGEGSLAEGEQPGEKGKGKAPGKGKGEGEGQGEGSESGSEGQQVASSNSDGNRRGSISTGSDGRGGQLPTGGQVTNQPLFFNRKSEQREAGAITGEDYKEFRDRLGNIEEMLPQNELRDAARRVADNARAMRVDFSRDNLPPEAAAIETRITEPLIELRQRISEEIAKLNKENPLVPIDRDPVPSEFRDLVRRYYEELGAGD